MSVTAGLVPAASPTAPAGSRETQSGYLLPARVVRREFARLFAEKGMATHPAEVRRIAEKFCASGRPLTDVEGIVIAYADPTGETAVRNVMRGAR